MLLQGHHTGCYKDTTQKKLIFEQTWTLIKVKLVAHRYIRIVHDFGDSRHGDPVKIVHNRPAVVCALLSQVSDVDLIFTDLLHLDKHRNTKSIHCMQIISLYSQSSKLITLKLQTKTITAS